MNVSLYQAAAALTAYSRWQENIAENLSCASVPGYRKNDLSFSAVQAGLTPTSAMGNANLLTVAQPSLNTTPGEIKATGVKTDVAIEGRGYFEVQLANGSTAYTRDGEFRISPQGQLTTKEGYLVMGESGPIQLDQTNSSPLAISDAGEISQAPDSKGKIKIVDFNEERLLTGLSGGYYLADNPGIQATPAVNSTVRQGYLEGSNTSTVTEMANLIAAVRSFEANQRVIQINDERMSRAINILGNNT